MSDSREFIVEPTIGRACQATDDQICAAALTWMQDEIKTGPASLTDIGKFFFTVSTGSIAAVAAIAKLGSSFQVGWVISLSMLLYLVSVALAVVIVFPRVWSLSSTTDLLTEYRKKIKRGRLWTIGWLLVWLTAVILSLVALSQ